MHRRLGRYIPGPSVYSFCEADTMAIFRNRLYNWFYRQRLSLLLTLLLLLGCAPGAFADETSAAEDTGIIDAAALDSWISDYVAQHSLDGAYQVFSVGFCYTGTGDCWFYNADQWMYSASLYKVPVSMLLAEKEAAGELTQDSMITTQYASGTLGHLESTALINSNNDSGHALVEYMGGTYAGKCADQTVRFTGLPESYFSSDDFANLSYYTARYMTHVMKTLYDGGDEAYPHIIEYLLDAQPDDYYNSDANLKSSYAIAQKYGAFTEQNGNNNNHCAAIIYTPTPIVVVVMTRNVGDYQRRMAEVGSYLADYSLQLDEKQAALEREAQEQAAALAAAEADNNDAAAQAGGSDAGTGTEATAGEGTAQALPAGTQNAEAVTGNAADRNSALRIIAASCLTGLFMLAVGLAAGSPERGKRRRRKK